MISRILSRNLICKHDIYRNCLSRLSVEIRKSTIKRFSTKAEAEELEEKPLPYIGSEAAKWKAEYSRTGDREEPLWYQAYVVVFSTTVFLLYFCVLREENDIDEKLYRPIDPNIYQIEKQKVA